MSESLPQSPRSICDLFEFHRIPYSPYRDVKSCPFYISFPDVEAGWLEVRLSYVGKSIAYSASYVLGDGGMEPLLDAVIDLLPYVGDYDKYFKFVRTHTRFIHCLEPAEYVWDICSSGSTLRILLREDPNLEYDDDRFYFSDVPEFLEHSYPGVTQEKLQSQVLMAVEIDQNVFVAKLYMACFKLLEKTGPERYKQEWKKKFPRRQLHRLKQYMLFCFPYQWGYWEYEGSDMANRFKGEIGTKTFEVIGRRMCTVEELKTKNLW